MTWPGTSGRAVARSATMPPVSCDMTATGCNAVGQRRNVHTSIGLLTPIVMSFEVAKNQ
jgi:hypothetical protein